MQGGRCKVRGKESDGGGDLADLRFSDEAERAEALAYEIGLKPNEFWYLSPAEFFKYTEGYRKKERNDLYGFALVSSMIAEVNRDRKKRRKPYTPKDFMPQPGAGTRKKQTAQEMFSIVKMLNAAFGGTITE